MAIPDPDNLPDDETYRMRWRDAVHELVKQSKTICGDLHPVDAVGAYLSAAVTMALSAGMRPILRDMLSEVSKHVDEVDGGTVN